MKYGYLPLGDVDGAPDRVLVKFYFCNRKHIPDGIPERERDTDRQVDEEHATWAIIHQMAEKAMVGRVRRGRVDTGEHIVDNLGDAQVATLRRGFTNAHYLLADAHWFEAPAKEKGRQPKFVVCLTFSRVDIDINNGHIPELPRRTLNALRELANSTWQFCHVWNNPDGVATINCVGRRWNEKFQTYYPPKNAIRVMNGEIVAIPVTKIVAEAEEA